MAVFGHSGSQAPQLMHSLVIIVAMRHAYHPLAAPFKRASGDSAGPVIGEKGWGRRAMANQDEPRPERTRTAPTPFVFYSALHGRPVEDAAGVPLGRLDDVAVALAETFPSATALVVRRGRIES